MPKDSKPTPRKAELMHRMAAHLDVSIRKAVQSGVLLPDTAARMENHCDACAASAACEAFLNQHLITPAPPPDYCINRRILTFLADSLPKSKP